MKHSSDDYKLTGLFFFKSVHFKQLNSLHNILSYHNKFKLGKNKNIKQYNSISPLTVQRKKSHENLKIIQSKCK